MNHLTSYWGEPPERAPPLAGLHWIRICMSVCLLTCGHILIFAYVLKIHVQCKWIRWTPHYLTPCRWSYWMRQDSSPCNSTPMNLLSARDRLSLQREKGLLLDCSAGVTADPIPPKMRSGPGGFFFWTRFENLHWQFVHICACAKRWTLTLWHYLAGNAYVNCAHARWATSWQLVPCLIDLPEIFRKQP